jgi:hypothetical protein
MSVDLAQLRDIHLPEPVGWWPPAPGWWLLLAALLALFLLLSLWRRQARLRRWRREARTAISRLRQQHQQRPESGRAVVEQLSALLRRIAITRFPAVEVASLSGEAWLQFLDRPLKGSNAFQQGAGRLLAQAPYRSQHVNIREVEALLNLAERWLAALPGSRQ